MSFSPLSTFLLVFAMLVLSALFCTAETALLSSSKARLNHAVRQGDRRAQVALNLLKHPDQMLGTILIVLTLVPIASSALTTQLMMRLFGPVGVAYGTAALGLMVLLVGEAFPKAVGTRFPEPIALALARLMHLCVMGFYPLTYAIKLFNHGVLRLLGLHGAHGSSFTEADMRGALNMGLEQGALRASQHRMMEAVLDLEALTVGDVMVHRSSIVSIDLATPPAELPQLLGKMTHSRVLVYDGQPDNLVGILYVRDYLVALANVANRTQVSLRKVLRPLYFVPETTPAGYQLLEFLKHHRHMAVVVDEYGDVLGLLTLEDLLEEIVGEIPDELVHADVPERENDGSITLEGNIPVREANRQFGWMLDDEAAVTLGGLVVEKLGHMPTQGEQVTLKTRRGDVAVNYVLTVISKRGQRVEKVRVTPVAEIEKED